MFKLLRFFSVSAGILICCLTMALVAAYQYHATATLVEATERQNVALATSFGNALWPRFSKYVISQTSANGDAIRGQVETAQIDAAVRQLAKGLQVLKVKIYNPNGMTVYSSEPAQIGQSKSDSPGFQRTLQTKSAESKLSFRNSFSAFSGTLFKRDVVETYVAIQDQTGNITGVFELYTDVTSGVAFIRQFVWTVTSILILAFGCLFGALLLIVRRADQVLVSQYAQLQDFNENLEHLVNQRTLEAETAARVAEEANRAKSVFLANMSHEIRTPMNGVLGMVDILSRSSLSVRQRHQLTLIHNSAQTLLGLLNNILDLSRIEAGRVQIDAAPFDLREIVGDAVDLLAEQAQSKDLELAYTVDDTVPTCITGDQIRLRQILINLIGNAIKFTESGSIVLRVSNAESHAVKKAVVRFVVCDTGIGIDASVGRKLFDPFQQGDPSVTRRFGGSGLGLSISSHLVELMGGKLDYTSRLKEGSEFYFALPFARSKQPARQDLGRKRLLAGCRALIADDSNVNTEIVSNYLKSWSVDCTATSDGEAVIRELKRASEQGAPYSILLLSSSLPDMCGLQLASRLKCEPEIRNTKIVLLTPMNWAADINSAWGDNIVCCVTKPLRQSQLFEALAKSSRTSALQLSGQGGEASDVPAPATASRTTFNAHVLVVEDNPVNQEVAAEYLRGFGCTLDIVDNGLDATTAVTDRDYDVIFMDCQMPQLDGYEATRRILANEKAIGAKHVPIVALTAGALKGDRTLCIAAGMDDYVSKPFSDSEILAMLHKWLPEDRRQSTPVASTEMTQRATTGTSADGVVTDQPEPLDRQHIVALRTNRPSLLKRLTMAYLEHSAPLIKGLTKAVSEADFVSIKLNAHSLKSSSANVGASVLAEHCQLLEVHAQNGALEAAQTTVEKVCDEFERVKAALLAENAELEQVAHG